MVHTTAGYLVYAALTTKVCFDLKNEDVFACTADIGWITGHTYSIYGPLLNGVTTVIFGGTPVHPDYYRLFKLVQSLGITQLYTAPTVVRTLRKYFLTNEFEGVYNLNSLRLLGSVGEPINKDAYKWFTESFNNLHIVDSYWQTETGGIMIAPIPYAILGQPECASLPFFGVSPVIVKPESTSESIIEASPYELGHVCFRGSWPGIARTILNDDKRYKSSYFNYDGLYFTGDEGYVDENNLFWIRGRADDVINVSGHRLSTAEIESAACTDPNVAEAAVVAIDDEITGQGLCFFIAVKQNISEEEASKSLRNTLRNKIGKLVNPKKIVVVKGLPKTSTGKIMRRVLRDILLGTVPEDLSTCTNIESIEAIRNASFGKTK
uniref:acetate--CoA ligase n=1 Tax=Nosema pernyi TaxID=1112939 RepID=A0A0N7ABI8_9MICR|nr:acetyl-coenzyme A synthetase [Nosema pernyi]